MPCNTVQTTTVRFTVKAESRDLLKLALTDLGYADIREDASGLHFRNKAFTLSGTIDAEGRCNIRSNYGAAAVDANTINRAYSHRVIQSQAKKFGWQLKQQGDKYVAVKR